MNDLFSRGGRAEASYTAKDIEVLEGLEPGETVVATGWWRLRDGARVAVVGL